MAALVRLQANDRSLILRALDLGAQGVVIPHVSTRADAELAVRAAKYGSQGRGACPLVRANSYGLGNWSEYESAANENTMVIVLIEDLEGAANVEDILSVKGVDVVYLGPFDMSVGAGHKGNVSHPEIQEALDRVLCACRERKVPAMHSLINGPQVEMWAEKGVRLFVQTADSFVFARASRELLDSVAHLRVRKFV